MRLKFKYTPKAVHREMAKLGFKKQSVNHETKIDNRASMYSIHGDSRGSFVSIAIVTKRSAAHRMWFAFEWDIVKLKTR